MQPSRQILIARIWFRHCQKNKLNIRVPNPRIRYLDPVQCWFCRAFLNIVFLGVPLFNGHRANVVYEAVSFNEFPVLLRYRHSFVQHFPTRQVRQLFTNNFQVQFLVIIPTGKIFSKTFKPIQNDFFQSPPQSNTISQLRKQELLSIGHIIY